MRPIFKQRFRLAALAGLMAVLSGCKMPTASLGQGPAAKSSDVTAPSAAAATPSAATPAGPSPASSSSPGAPAPGAVASPSLAGDLAGVNVPSPSTGLPPTGLPGGTASTAPPSSFGPATTGGSSGSSGRAQVQLSAGVALAQTLPDGTGMLFSIDYRFSQGRPDQSTRYFWVITSRDKPLRRQVQLRDSGTLQAVVPGMRPEVGPFQCHLEALAPGASQPTAISGRARMVSDNVPR